VDNEPGVIQFWSDGFGATPLIVSYDGVSPTTVKIASGSATATTVATMTEGNTYHVWWHYLKGAGANDDTAEVWFSTTTTKPADASNNHAKVTGGTTDAQMKIILIGSDGGNGHQGIFDKLRIDDAAIGSSPL
jgi:hypothetical protein